MEFERYEDVIDAFERDNMGYETLTDYIKGNNIKIAEIDMSPMGDLAKAFNKKDGGMMIAIEQLGKGGITGGKTYHQYHDQFVPPDSESERYANGGGIGSMMQPKKKFVEQDGYKNYIKNSKSVTVPKEFKSRSDATPTKLAYITAAEAKMLKKQNKGTPHKGPSGIPSYDDYDAQTGNYTSGAAMSAMESGSQNARDRAEIRASTDYGGPKGLAPGVKSKAEQEIRNAFIAAGGGQRVNPGFFDSRNYVSPAELAAAKASNPAAFAAGRKGSGLLGFLGGGGILGALVRGLGQKLGFGKTYNEPTYDMSEFNQLGLGGIDPFANLDIRDKFNRTNNTNVIDKKPPANIKGTNLNDFEIGDPGKYATANIINEFGVKAATPDDPIANLSSLPGSADDRFANMYEDPFGNPTNDSRIVSEEMGLVGDGSIQNQIPQGITFNNPVGGVDQYAKEMEALEASLPNTGINTTAIVPVGMLSGTLQDFYTNKNLTGAATQGKPTDANTLMEIYNDQASLPGNNMVAEITQADIDRFKQPMTQMMDYDTYKSINTDSTLTEPEFNQLKAQV